MKGRLWIIIGITIAAAVYLPIHYYYPFLGIGVTTRTFVFCENGFVQSDDRCIPNPENLKDISVDVFADEYCPSNTLEQNETGAFLTCLHTNDDPKEVIFNLPQHVQ